jgi:hypothetical protein
LYLKDEEDQIAARGLRPVKDGSRSAGKKPGSSVGCERRTPPERFSISGVVFFQGKSVFVPSKPSWPENVGGQGMIVIADNVQAIQSVTDLPVLIDAADADVMAAGCQKTPAWYRRISPWEGATKKPGSSVEYGR